MEIQAILPYVVAVLGSLISYLSAKSNTEKALKNEIEKLDKSNQHEIEKLMKQHEVDIDNIKEVHKLELEKMTYQYKHELEKIEKETQMQAMGAIFSKIGDRLIESPDLQKLIDQGLKRVSAEE